jgi:hypothetical protein
MMNRWVLMVSPKNVKKSCLEALRTKICTGVVGGSDMVKQKEQLGDSVALKHGPARCGRARCSQRSALGVPEIQRFERLVHSLTVKVRMNEDDEMLLVWGVSKLIEVQCCLTMRSQRMDCWHTRSECEAGRRDGWDGRNKRGATVSMSMRCRLQFSGLDVTLIFIEFD